MDYQSVYSVDKGSYNARYISFGNFNYGVVMAAAGFSLEEAEFFAAIVNTTGGGEKSHILFGGNPKNEAMIEKGYEAYNKKNLPEKKN